MIEAPRSTLIHHNKVNPAVRITWANLIVATGHNNLAMGQSVNQVSKHLIDGHKLNEGMRPGSRCCVRLGSLLELLDSRVPQVCS